jgi:hypothetical protein
MPNALAFAALYAWPAVALLIFRALPPGRALLASLIGGYLLLPPAPAAIPVPLMPLTKDNLPLLSAFAAAWLLHGPALRARLLPQHPLARGLVALIVVTPTLTILANPDPIFDGRVAIPGMGWRDALGLTAVTVTGLLPLILARAFLATEEDRRDTLWALLAAGLLYSLPMLLEVRLAPILNIWVYGYFQHVFSQMVRGDGWRPIVFLYHGLWAAFLALTALLAACALLRAGAGARGSPEAAGRRAVLLALAALWMLMTLVLCKSLGSLLYAIVAAPLILFLPRRWQLRAAALMALLALTYPLARGAYLVPTDSIVAAVESFAPERANSLDFRFDNEARLLARAEDRPLFGWGPWGRNHVWNRDTGAIETIADGRWIVILGMVGWSGFLGEFGLLSLPLLLGWARLGAEPPSAAAAGLAIILGVNLVDLLPNATLTPLTLLVAGVLLAWAEGLAPDRARAREPAFRTVL